MRKAQMVHAREALKRLGFKEVGDYLKYKVHEYGTIEIPIENFNLDPESAFFQALDWFITKALAPKSKGVDEKVERKEKETKKVKK